MHEFLPFGNRDDQRIDNAERTLLKTKIYDFVSFLFSRNRQKYYFQDLSTHPRT